MRPALRIASVARARSCAGVHREDATPTTGTLRTPRRAIAYSAGKIILWARSPVTPNRTSASDGAISAASPIEVTRRGRVEQPQHAPMGRRDEVSGQLLGSLRSFEDSANDRRLRVPRNEKHNLGSRVDQDRRE